MDFSALAGPKFSDAGEMIVASDAMADRQVTFVRRNSAGNVELMSRRDGPSGSLYTLREFRESDKNWRYLSEGETIEELAKNLDGTLTFEFSETLDGSIADVALNHALGAIKEIEVGASQ